MDYDLAKVLLYPENEITGSCNIELDIGKGAIMDIPMKVLIVDDELLISQSLEITLQCYGYNVISTDSGFRAINAAQAEHFHIALLDIAMPNMNGVELMAELRRIAPHTIIIMMTAHDNNHPLVKKAMAEKPDKLIHKPFDPIQLVSIIDYYRDLVKSVEPPY
ncbi:response regulator [Chloroflexota bacterium]